MCLEWFRVIHTHIYLQTYIHTYKYAGTPDLTTGNLLFTTDPLENTYANVYIYMYIYIYMYPKPSNQQPAVYS